MQIALGGLIILIILLPGISFRKGYFSEEFSNQYTIRDFFQLFINTLFPSFIAYFIFLPVVFFPFGYYYDLGTLLGILSSNDELVESSIEKIEQFSLQILIFQILINSFSFLTGYFLRNFVLHHSFDARNKFFRYKNIWHYLLSAKFMLFERSQIELQENSINDVDVTYLDALIVLGDYSFIYTGILVDYELSEDGSLDLLYIKDAQRKLIEHSPSDTNYKDINGHIIILKYKDVVNLNLSFIQIEEIGENQVEFKLIS